MISVRIFAFVASIVSTAYAAEGTCTNGQDQIGVSQTCGGRCHVYSVGDYGACGDQVTSAMLSKDCGTSPQNACISTFNAGWDSSKLNCGNCYYVQMKYKDGSVNSVYLKTIDTNGSETKFEMMQYAWQKLCPYICRGAGECANKESQCTDGAFPETLSYPISCAAQSGEVTFERVPCDGTGTSQITSSSGSSSSTSSKDKHSSNSSSDKYNNNGGSPSSPASSSSSSGSSSVNKSSNSSKKSSKKSKSDSSDSTDSATDDSDTTSSDAAEVEETATVVERCREAMGGIHLRNECQARCSDYAERPIICGGQPLTVADLIACVARLNPSCA